MGYCMDMREFKFFIPAENKDAARDAIKELVNHPEWMYGGVSRGKDKTESWYSWTNTKEIANALTLKEAIEAFRWQPTTDRATGNIDGIYFNGEKMGQEDIMFKAIASFVEDGSYIEMEGEDGEIWRWVFDCGKLYKVRATITFEDFGDE